MFDPNSYMGKLGGASVKESSGFDPNSYMGSIATPETKPLYKGGIEGAAMDAIGGASSYIMKKIANKDIKGQSFFVDAVSAADDALFKATGNHILIGENFRTNERQKEIRAKFGYTSDSQASGAGGRPMAAPPGTSFHEKGLAIDVGNYGEAAPYLAKYGIINGLKGDMGHFSIGEMNPGALKKAKTTPSPVGLDTPERLAEYATKYGGTDLQSKDWWKNNPNKQPAWQIIQKNKSAEVGAAGLGSTLGNLFSGKKQAAEKQTIPYGTLLVSPLKSGGALNQSGGVFNQPSVFGTPGILYQGSEATQKALADDSMNALRPMNNAIDRSTGINIMEFFASNIKPYEYSVNEYKKSAPLSGETTLSAPKPNEKLGMAEAFGSGFVSGSRLLGGKENYSSNATANEIGEAIVPAVLDGMTLYDLGAGISWLWNLKRATKALVVGGELAGDISRTTMKFTAEELKTAASEITSGVKTGAKPEALAAVKTMIEDAGKGSSLVQQIAKGGDISVKREFLDWFRNTTNKLPEEALTPEIKMATSNIEKALTEKGNVDDAVKEVIHIFNPSASTAALRDSIDVAKATPGIVDNTLARKANILADSQKASKNTVALIKEGGSPILQVDTFKYSDGKIGVSFDIDTESGGTTMPFTGKFATEQEAIDFASGKIQDFISKNLDTSDETVKKQLERIEEEVYNMQAKTNEPAHAEVTQVSGDQLYEKFGNKNLPETALETQKKAFDFIAQNEDALLQEYTARFGNEVSADKAKELFPEYNGTNSDAIHKPSSYLSNKLFELKLVQNKGFGNNTVLFTAGGTGAGKTSALKNLDKSVYPVIYDGNLKDFNKGAQRIGMARDNGYKVKIYYVSREPIEAFVNGVIPRGSKTGRVVNIDTHVGTHLDSRTVLGQMLEKYQGNPNIDIKVIDNNYGKGNSKIVANPFEFLAKESYDKEALRKQLHGELSTIYQRGGVQEAFYRATEGSSGGARKGVHENRTANGGQSEQVRPGGNSNLEVYQSLQNILDPAIPVEDLIVPKKALDIVNRYVGDLADVEYRPNFKGSDGERKLGAFIRGINEIDSKIIISGAGEGVHKTTPYHEIAHLYFREVLTAEQRAQLLVKVKKQYSKLKLDDAAAEERLVQDFAEDVAGQERIGYKGLIHRIMNFIRGLVDKIRGIYSKARFEMDILRKRRAVGEVVKGEVYQRFTELKDRGKKPSVTDIGVRIPEKPFVDTGKLSTKILSRLEGKTTVSRQFIEDLTNSGDVKQVEKDLIRDLLKDEGEKVNVERFANKVKAELLPLKRLDLAEASDVMNGENYLRYENISLPDEIKGNVANYSENIYESPVKTQAGQTHFGGDTKNYFGHTRIEDMADNTTRRVIEVQSDLYQKGRLEGEKPNGHPSAIPTAFSPSEQVRFNLLQSKFSDNKKLEKVELQEYEVLSQRAIEMRDNYIAKGKADFQKLQQYNDPTAHFRMVREELKQAAQDGKQTVLFPTGETAMKIEGLGQLNHWHIPRGEEGGGRKLELGDLEKGKEIVQATGLGYEKWIITDVSGDTGIFKAVRPPSETAIANIRGARPPYKMTHQAAYDLLWKRKLEEPQFSEIFDISGEVDTNNPIYKFYEKELGRYLKNNYEAVQITDKQGVDWHAVNMEATKNKDLARRPVFAFKTGGNEELTPGKISEAAQSEADYFTVQAREMREAGETRVTGETNKEFVKRVEDKILEKDYAEIKDQILQDDLGVDDSPRRTAYEATERLIDAFSDKGAKFYLTVGKNYKGRIGDKIIEFKGKKTFAENFNKMFVESSPDEFYRNIRILKDQYYGTLFGTKINEVYNKFQTGLLDDQELFTEIIRPKLEEYAENKYRRKPTDITRTARKGSGAGRQEGGAGHNGNVPAGRKKDGAIKTPISDAEMTALFNEAPKTIQDDIYNLYDGVYLGITKRRLLSEYIARKGLSIKGASIVRDTTARGRMVSEKAGMPDAKELKQMADEGFNASQKSEQPKATVQKEAVSKEVSKDSQPTPAKAEETPSQPKVQSQQPETQIPDEPLPPQVQFVDQDAYNKLRLDKRVPEQSSFVNKDIILPEGIPNTKTSQVFKPARQKRKLPAEIAKALFADEELFKDLSMWKRTGFTTAAPIRAAEEMDGKRFGIFKKEFLFPIQDADKAFQIELKKKQAWIDDLFKGLNKAERVAVTDIAEDRPLKKGEKVTVAPRADLVEIAKKLREDYDSLFDRINEARKLAGKDPMLKRKNYITHFQELSAIEDILKMVGLNMTDVPNSMLQISMYTKPGSPYFKFAKRREADLRNIDAKAAAQAYLEPSLRVIHFSGPMKKARDIIEYKIEMPSEYEGGMIEKTSLFGMKYPNAYAYWTDYLNSLAGKRDILDKVFQPFAEPAGFVAKLFAPGAIGGNLATALKQIGSFRNTAAETGLFSIKGQLLINTPWGYKFYKNNSRVGLGRSYEPTTKTQRLFGSKILAKTHGAVSQFISIPVGTLDKEMVGGAFLSGYYQGKASGFSEADAIRFGDDVAERTQASANMVDRAPINRGKIKTMFGQFQTFVYNEWSQVKTDIGHKIIMGENSKQGYSKEGLGSIKEGRYKGAKRLFAFALSTVVLSTLYDELGLPNPFKNDSEYTLPGVENEQANEVARYLMGSIPYVSNVKFGGSPVIQGSYNVAIYLLGSEEQRKDAIKKLQGLGMRLIPGGGQISKTWDATNAILNKGEVKSASGKTVNFTIDVNDRWEVIKALAFGKYQTKAGQEYLSGGKDPLAGLSLEAKQQILDLRAAKTEKTDTDKEMLDRYIDQALNLPVKIGATTALEKQLKEEFVTARKAAGGYTTADNTKLKEMILQIRNARELKGLDSQSKLLVGKNGAEQTIILKNDIKPTMSADEFKTYLKKMYKLGVVTRTAYAAALKD